MFDNRLRLNWRTKKLLLRVGQYIILLLVMMIVFMPIVILVFGAFKTRGEFMTEPYTPPIPPRLDNVIAIVTKPSYSFWQMLRNSLIVMFLVTFSVVAICSLAAFVFARMQFRAKGLMFNLFTLGLMFPINIAILPVYFVLRQLDILDSLLAVIVVQTSFQLSGNIMILRGFFRAIPSELQDTAYIDGCTHFGFFWRILLPLARPALGAVAALTMIVSWNDLLVPLVVLNHDNLWTLPLGTMQFQGQYGQDLSLVAAFVMLSALPTVFFYFAAERQIVAGLTAGAIKG